MLILKRRLDEVIVIGDDIRIVVVDIRGDAVRLGISAPLEISVDRLEVHDAKARDAVLGIPPRVGIPPLRYRGDGVYGPPAPKAPHDPRSDWDREREGGGK